MILKNKTIEVYDIEFDEQSWVLFHEKIDETAEEYYIVRDLEGNEVIDEDLYDEIIEYFEGEEGEIIDPFSLDNYEEEYD